LKKLQFIIFLKKFSIDITNKFIYFYTQLSLATKVFLFIAVGTFEITYASFFKDKKSRRSHKTVGIKDFLTIFA
jgi:hypothetical protein